MARYVDGFLIPMPTRKLAAYRRLAAMAGRVWRKHGALAYVECAGDDLKVKGVRSFTRAARAKRGETVVFSWIVYRSRAHRDQVNAKVMKDPRIARMMTQAPIIDMKRMHYGGFKTLVDL
jgi:uncharacterized protein YbaA (DUF1428 family)